MRIGIDISQVVYGTGVSFYTKKLVQGLLKIDEKNEYILFGGSLRQQRILKDILQGWFHRLDYGTKNKSKLLPIPPVLADFLWNRLHILPIERLIGKVDVFHSSDWSQPPSSAAKVTTIHDLSFLRWPDSVHPQILAVQKRRLIWVKKEADLVIAVSKATKKEIIELLGIPDRKIRVIYEAAGDEFYPRDKKEIEKIKSKYHLESDYLLAVGAKQPRKNIERVIEATNNLALKSCSLVVVGEPLPNLVVKYLSAKVRFLNFIPPEEMPFFYSGALCLVYPSLYEGFGLPILQAFACGCPVVTSNASSLPEVAGSAAILVNPLEAEEISLGIEKAIKNREMLIEKGLRRTKLFSWEKTARKTLKVYKEVYERCKFRKG